jgi:long-chain acyl-CoA synthetase
VDYSSLLEMFFRVAKRHPTETALAAKADGRYQQHSYAAVEAQVRRLGAALVHLGVQAGDRVALMSENRPEWALTDLATYAAGGVVVPLYSTLPPPQVEYILRDSGACVFVVSGKERIESALALRGRLPNLRHIIAIGEDAPEGTIALDSLLAQPADPASEAESERRSGALNRDVLATIVYTSGTTGEPKGAMLTHGNILANLEGIDPVFRLDENDDFLSFLPLSHIFERTAGYYLAIRNASAIYYAESVFTVAKNLEEVRPTIMMSVPRLYENIQQRILDAASKAPPLQRRLFEWALQVGYERSRCRLEQRRPDPLLLLRHALADRLVLRRIRGRVGGRIRTFVAGGAPLPCDTAEFFLALDLLVLQGYGLTETSPVLAVNHPEEPRSEGVGRPLHNLELTIAEDGEICARGASIMKGYWNKPEETAAAIDSEGWFHTGDIGRLDEKGHLHITDRKKNLIVLSTGKKVAPQPIETRLKTSPFIGEVLVLGDQHSTVGALIVPRFDAIRAHNGLANLDDRAIAAHPEVRQLLRAEIDRLSDGLAEFERVKRFAVLDREFTVESGELTPSLKPRRGVILERFASQVNSLFRS